MRKNYTLLCVLSLISFVAKSADFTPGNIVVYRVGTGTGNLVNTGNAVFLDEYSPTGNLVQSIALPTTASGNNLPLIASGTATSEGFLTLSANGNFLVATGYGTATGGTSLSATVGTSVPRVVGLADIHGTVNTSTALTDFASGNNPRAAVSTNGVDIWVTGGAGGARYTTVGSTTSTQLSTTVINLRQLLIVAGQLYTSSPSGAIRIGTVGTGLPTTAGQTITTIPGFATATGSPYGFVFFDENAAVAGPDVLYVADDGVGITKYSLVGGSWVANGTVGTATDVYRGLTGSYNPATGSATFYATRKGGSGTTGGGELVSFTDASGYNASLGATVNLLATANANTAFRGIAFAPGTQGLPLQLLSFSATPKETTVAFSWTTANERNTHHFEIEQSFNGANFNSIATVAAVGNSTTERSYSYTGSLNATTTYYRLKMVDADGQSTTSAIVKVAPFKTGFALGNVYPVPAKNSVTVEWNSRVAGATTLSLTDISGHVVRTLYLQSVQGFNHYLLDIHALAAGQYFLRLKNDLNQVQSIITIQ